MLTFQKFMGINNVLPEARLKAAELRTALNVDVGLDAEIRRRQGYARVSDKCHKNLWQGAGFMLATYNGDLVKTVDGALTTLYPALGNERVWYVNLPDGRTAFTNGLISGITDGSTTTGWGVPLPSGTGALTDVAGQLSPGDYQYALTYKRLSDGLEGGAVYTNPVTVAQGGILLTGLPVLAGYAINVYINGRFGDSPMYAGTTLGAGFSFLGTNSQLVMPLRTDFLFPMPVGTVCAFWRGRSLVAEGGLLWASRSQQWELCDKRRDYKQFSGDITLIQPVDGGLFVGTTKELAFLSGTEFDKLVYTRVVDGAVVLGSGVEVRGELLKRQDRTGDGRAMVCVADGIVVAGFSDGGVFRLTEGRYRTNVTEVAATFRVRDGIPQYIAIPQ